MGLAKVKTAISTPEDYLKFEREADSRHEFIDGEIYAMAGKSLSSSIFRSKPITVGFIKVTANLTMF